MTARKWTPEIKARLAELWPRDFNRNVVAAINEEFGTDFTFQAACAVASKMGLRKRPERCAPRKAVRQVRWDAEPEMDAWMAAHDGGRPTLEVSEDFAAAFGFALSVDQVTNWRHRRGLLTKQGFCHGRSAPVGTERIVDGKYVRVKVRERPQVPGSKDNWELKHVMAWERANGRKLPEGSCVFTADGDMFNFDPGNLVEVPRDLVSVLNNRAVCPPWSNGDELRASLALARLRRAEVAAESRMPRTCGVCGKEFATSEGSPNSKHTCPECRRQGKKSQGRRVARCEDPEARCAVCGRKFERKSTRQRRCPECVARAPTSSVEAQKSKEVRRCRK